MDMSNETLASRLQDWIDQNSKEHKKIMEKQDATNGRVRKLEMWRSMLLGGLIVIGSLVGGGAITLLITTF